MNKFDCVACGCDKLLVDTREITGMGKCTFEGFYCPKCGLKYRHDTIQMRENWKEDIKRNTQQP